MPFFCSASHVTLFAVLALLLCASPAPAHTATTCDDCQLEDDVTLLQQIKHISTPGFQNLGHGLCQSDDGWFLDVGYVMPQGTCPSSKACMQKCAEDAFCGAFNWGSGDCWFFGWMADKPYTAVKPDWNSQYECFAKLVNTPAGNATILTGFKYVADGRCESDDEQFVDIGYAMPPGTCPDALACQEKCYHNSSCAAIGYGDGECWFYAWIDDASYTKAKPGKFSAYGCYVKKPELKKALGNGVYAPGDLATTLPGFMRVGRGRCESDDGQFLQPVNALLKTDGQGPVGPTACQQACANDPYCGAINFGGDDECLLFKKSEDMSYTKANPDLDSQYRCWVKWAKQTARRTAISGFRGVGQGLCQSDDEWFLDIGFVGKPLHWESKEACMQECASNYTCGAFGWSDTKTCFWFGSMEGKPYTKVKPDWDVRLYCYVKLVSKTSATGTLPGMLAAKPDVIESEDLIDHGFAMKPGTCPNAIACQQACLQDDSCKAINFSSGDCSFFGKTEDEGNQTAVTDLKDFQLTCVDKQPPKSWKNPTCELQKSAGMCKKKWNKGPKGYCRKTCGTCEADFMAGEEGADSCPIGYAVIKDPELCRIGAKYLDVTYFHKTTDLDHDLSLCNYCGGCSQKDGSQTVRVDSTHDKKAMWICLAEPETMAKNFVNGVKEAAKDAKEAAKEAAKTVSSAASSIKHKVSGFFNNNHGKDKDKTPGDLYIREEWPAMPAHRSAYTGFRGRGQGLCVSADDWYLDIGFAMPQGTCPSKEVCMKMCDDDAKCGAINWGDSGDCWFMGWMDGKPYTKVAPAMNFQYYCFSKIVPASERSNNTETLPGFKYLGDGLCASDEERFVDIGYAMPPGTCPGALACEQACQYNSSCAAIGYGDGDCWFYGNLDIGSYTKAKPGKFSAYGCYVKWASMMPRRVPYSGFRGVGQGMCESSDEKFNDIGYAMPKGSCPSKEECMERCDQDASCGAINWGDNGDCWFFGLLDAGKTYTKVKAEWNPQYYCFVKLAPSLLQVSKPISSHNFTRHES